MNIKASGIAMRTLWLVLPVVVALIASQAWGEDLEDCIARAKQANVSCWDRCRSNSCIARCDTTFNREKGQCREGLSASKQSFSGTTKNGQDGCYYGECPEDLPKRIEESKPERKKIEEEPEDVSEPPSRPRPRPSRSAQVTNVCQTPMFWCVMNQTGPVNYPCWCSGPLGMANGVTVPSR